MPAASSPSSTRTARERADRSTTAGIGTSRDEVVVPIEAEPASVEPVAESMTGEPAEGQGNGQGNGQENGQRTPVEKGKTPRRARRGRTAGPSIPLGSLTQREHRAAIHCQACGSTRVTRLAMNLTDGTPVEFTSCHRCEHRTWETAGDTLSVGTVLDRTRRD